MLARVTQWQSFKINLKRDNRFWFQRTAVQARSPKCPPFEFLIVNSERLERCRGQVVTLREVDRGQLRVRGQDRPQEVIGYDLTAGHVQCPE